MASNLEFDLMANRGEQVSGLNREWRKDKESPYKDKESPYIEKLLNNKLSKRLKRRTDFYRSVHGLEVFPEVNVTNRYGVVIASTGGTNYFVEGEVAHPELAYEHGFWVGDVKYDAASNIYTCNIAINLYGPEGDFIGSLNVVLNIDDIINIIEEFEEVDPHGHGEHKGTVFKLITKDYRLIYSTDKFTPFEDVSELQFAIFGKLKSNTHRDSAVTTAHHESDRELLFSHAHSHGFRNYNGLCKRCHFF